MFYVLLVMPHLVAMVGLAVFAYRYGAADRTDDDFGFDDGTGGERPPGGQPPGGPEPDPPLGPLPLDAAGPPARRLRVGERLAELHPRPSRREHAPQQPARPRVKR